MKKNTMEFEYMQRVSKAMVMNAAIIMEWAKSHNVSIHELMEFLETPEGYQKMIQFSSKVYVIGVECGKIEPITKTA